MEFKVLGPMEVSESGRLIEIGPRMQRAVLALLVVDAGRVVSVDRLTDELWGDELPGAATGVLQGYVSNLRRALEPERAPRAPPRLLVTQPPGYVLRVPLDAVDAARFETLAAQGRAHLAAGRPDAAQDALGRGLRLWRGLPYADVELDGLRPEVTRLVELRAVATEDLVEAELTTGEQSMAVADIERLVAAEPLRERRWELLILSLYRCGRQAEALRAFQQARRTLGEELGIEPGPALRRLEASVLAQDPSIDWHPPPPGPQHPVIRDTAPPPTVDVPAHTQSTGAGRLVGRQQELVTLTPLLDEAVGGRGRVVLVSGEAGIGKTRLVEELAVEATRRGMAVAWGRCLEDEAPGFWPWIEIVRSTAAADPGGVAGSLGTGAAEVAQIVPEIKELAGSIQPPVVLDPETARVRLYDAVSTFLVRQAERRPLLLVVEDAHWADVASLRLLEFLARRARRAGVVAVATYRDVEVGPDHPLGHTLAALAREPAVVRQPLAGLDPEHVALLLSDALGADPAPPVVTDLHRRTGGNPFFLVELLRLLASEHDLHAEPEARLRHAIPAGVRDVVRRRMARLSSDASALLAAGAVAGREFDLDVVAEAKGATDEDEALDLIEEALVSGVVQEVSGHAGHYRFSHDLVRETLYEELSGLRKARLHRRVGEALESVGRGDAADVVRIAQHLWHGVAAGGADKAFGYALRAAGGDLGGLAYEQAEEHLRRALSLLEYLPAGPERARQELAVHERLSLLLLMSHGYSAPEVGLAVADDLQLSRALGDDHHLLRSTWRLLSFHVLRAEYAPAHDLALSLVEHAEVAADPAFATIGQQALGAIAFNRGDLIDAREHLERAIELAEQAELAGPGLAVAPLEVHPAAFARSHLALAVWLLGNGTRAEKLMREALATAGEDPHSISFTLNLAASLASFRGDAGEARDRADESLALASRHGFRQIRSVAAILRAWAAVELDPPEGSTKALKEALNEGGAAGARQWSHFFLGLLARALWRRDRPRAALVVLDRALDHAATTGERFYEPELHRLRAEIVVASSPENASLAVASLQRAVALAKAQGSLTFLARAQQALDGSQGRGMSATPPLR